MKSKFRETQEKEQKVITEKWIYFSTEINNWDNILVQKELR